MSTLARSLAAAILCLATACASGGAARADDDPAVAEGRTMTPPRPRGNSRPTLDFSRESTSRELRVDYSVMVEADGRPDASTIKVTGNMIAENRIAIERWLESSTFEPATVNGAPVRGELKGSIRAKAQVRVVRTQARP